jgi:hypothetical protein
MCPRGTTGKRRFLPVAVTRPSERLPIPLPRRRAPLPVQATSRRAFGNASASTSSSFAASAARNAGSYSLALAWPRPPPMHCPFLSAARARAGRRHGWASARARVRSTPPFARHKDPESAKSRRPEGPQDLTTRLSHVARRPVKSDVNGRHATADVLMRGPEEPERIPGGGTGRHHPERLRNNVVVGRVGAQADDRAGLARGAGPFRQPTHRRCSAFGHSPWWLDGCCVDRERHTRHLDHRSAPSAARDRVRRPRAAERARGCRRQGRSRHFCHAL